MIFRITLGKQTYGFRFSGRKAVEFDRERDRSPVIQVGSKTYQGLGEIFQTSVEAWMKDDFIYDVYHTLKGLVKISGHDIAFLKGE